MEISKAAAGAGTAAATTGIGPAAGEVEIMNCEESLKILGIY